MAAEQSLLQVVLIILAILGFVMILAVIGPWFADIINKGKLIEVFLLYIDGFVQLGQKIGGLFGWIGQLGNL